MTTCAERVRIGIDIDKDDRVTALYGRLEQLIIVRAILALLACTQTARAMRSKPGDDESGRHDQLEQYLGCFDHHLDHFKVPVDSSIHLSLSPLFSPHWIRDHRDSAASRTVLKTRFGRLQAYLDVGDRLCYTDRYEEVVLYLTSSAVSTR